MDGPDSVRLLIGHVESDVADTLGPGRRAVVWVQGCTIGCPGCIVPESWSTRRGRWADPAALARDLLAEHPGVDLTVSGGEPTEQPVAVGHLLRAAHALGRTTWVYTGRVLDDLLAAGDDDVLTMLADVDVLVDGRYEQSRHDARAFRGSANQRTLRLTDRIGVSEAASGAPGRIDIRVNDGELVVIGIPDRDVLARIRSGLHERGIEVSDRGGWR